MTGLLASGAVAPPPAYPPPDKRVRPAVPLTAGPAAGPAKALTPYGEFIAAVAALVEAPRVAAALSTLAAFPTRHTDSPHCAEAAQWLRDEFTARGYTDVAFHDFMHAGAARHNVVCTKTEAVDPAEHLVVCAHYDTRMAVLADSSSAAPGADDNGSGVTALLEIARVLRAIDLEWSLRLIAFAGEEQGLLGSTAYATAAHAGGVQIPLLVNLDMIGHATTPMTIVVERDIGNFTPANDGASQAFGAQMAQAAADYTALATQLGPIYSSDYMPFEHFGYVCIGCFDGADNQPFYHSTTDTVDKVQLPFCTEVVRLVVATALEVAGKRAGATLVFDPDPITASGNPALTPASLGLDALRRPFSLQHLDPPDGAGNHHLAGTAVRLVDAVAPAVAPPALADGVFVFPHTAGGFEAAMAYAHIDRFHDFVASLGFAGFAPAPIDVDAHGPSSHYDPVANRIALAGDEGEDAAIVLHQYARAIQATQKPGFASSDGLGSGFGDLVGAVYHDEKHANPAATRGITAPWAKPGRRYDRPWTFDDPAVVGEAARGELWASAVFALYRNLGGASGWAGSRAAARDLTLKLHLKANALVAATAPTATAMAQQLEAADGNLGGWRALANGLHKKVIYDEFARRKLSGYPAPATDVYVDDGRDGGYAWRDVFWDCHDIWVRTTPYASAADQATGGPGDHSEPPVGATAYLYVRVKNRGTDGAGSGAVTVKAYHSVPNLGLVWPEAWTPMDTASLNLPNVVPGPGGSQIVGPFPWTPSQVGHECVVVICECANDRAITQDLLATDHVSHANLVPFDNNIAQRNLFPTSPEGTTKRGFYVGNPDREGRAGITVTADEQLPPGWRWHSTLPDDGTVMLEPGERRWIDVTIDQAEGGSVTAFDRPYGLTLTGAIEDRPIGGVSFYVAAPGTIPEDRERDRGELTGDLTLRLRFHRH